LQHPLFLLSPLFQLVSLDPEETVLLSITHVLALEHLVDLSAVEPMMVPLALGIPFRFHLSQVVLRRRFLRHLAVLALYDGLLVVDAAPHVELLHVVLPDSLRLRVEA